MDIIQQILLALKEWIEMMKEIFFFVNSQFLPMTDDNSADRDKHWYR